MKNEGLLKKILEQLELLKGEQIVALAEEGKFADIKRIQEKIEYSKVIDYFLRMQKLFGNKEYDSKDTFFVKELRNSISILEYKMQERKNGLI